MAGLQEVAQSLRYAAARTGAERKQREQALRGQGDDLAAVADARLDMGDVGQLAGAVDDQKQMIAPVDEHQVVDDGAFVGQQQAVALLVHAQADHVHGHQRLQRAGSVGPDELQLAHVRDVEQAGGFAHLLVLGDQAVFVLHRHRIAGKGHHAGAQLDVQGVQWGGEQIGGIGHALSPCKGSRASIVACEHARLSALPERFTRAMPRLLLRWRALPPPLSSPVAPGCPGVCQSFCLSVWACAARLRRRRDRGVAGRRALLTARDFTGYLANTRSRRASEIQGT